MRSKISCHEKYSHSISLLGATKSTNMLRAAGDREERHRISSSFVSWDTFDERIYLQFKFFYQVSYMYLMEPIAGLNARSNETRRTW
jgi:hypothetical protein